MPTTPSPSRPVDLAAIRRRCYVLGAIGGAAVLLALMTLAAVSHPQRTALWFLAIELLLGIIGCAALTSVMFDLQRYGRAAWPGSPTRLMLLQRLIMALQMAATAAAVISLGTLIMQPLLPKNEPAAPAPPPVQIPFRNGLRRGDPLH